MTDTILYSRTGYVGRLVLNNPERHNALGREQLDAIRAALVQVSLDPEVRVLIITGTGEKTFCAGASLHELSDGLLGDDDFQKMTGQLADLAIPTICAMNGDVFGGGAELAVSCDFRIGIEGSRLRVPAAAIGLCYPASGVSRFVEILGPGLSKRILVSAEEFAANTLLDVGFFDHLVSPKKLDDFANSFAERIANLAPLAVQAMKLLIRQSAAGTLDFNAAEEVITRCLQSQDLQEGFAAKREKRTPQFNGR